MFDKIKYAVKNLWDKLKNITPDNKGHVALPLVPIIKRYWALIGIVGGAAFIAQNDWLFKLFGQLIYLPILAFGSIPYCDKFGANFVRSYYS